MKYETIKPFSPLDFILAYQKDCEKEKRGVHCLDFRTDLKWFLSYCSGNPFEFASGVHMSAYFEANPEFRKYLVKYGFVREVEPEVFYSIGDRFRRDYDGDEYILA